MPYITERRENYMRKLCSSCLNTYPAEVVEVIYDNRKKKNYCQYCLEDIVPGEIPRPFIFNYNRLTKISLERLVNVQ